MPTMQLATVHLWDRTSNESDAAWSAFVYFRDLGPEARSLGAVSRDLSHSDASVRRWNKKYNWQMRVVAWDIKNDQIHQKAYEDEIKLMAERHARLGISMQGLGGKRIQQFADSEALQAELTARDAIALIDTGVKIERESHATEKDKPVEGSGITINFNMPMPSWAPPHLRIADAEVLETNGANSQEATTRTTAKGD